VGSLRSSDVRVEPRLGVMQNWGRWEGLLVSIMLLGVPRLWGHLGRKLRWVTVLVDSHQTGLLLVRWSGRDWGSSGR